MPDFHTQHVSIRRFLDKARRILSLVFLALKILKLLFDLWR